VSRSTRITETRPDYGKVGASEPRGHRKGARIETGIRESEKLPLGARGAALGKKQFSSRIEAPPYFFQTISKCCADSGDESGCFYIWWAVRPPWPLPPRTHGLFFGIRAVIAQYEPVTTHERTRGQKKRAQRVPVHSERNDGGPSVRRRGALLGKRSLTLADHDATAIIRRARYVGPPRPIR